MNFLAIKKYFSWIAMWCFPISHFMQIEKVISSKHTDDISYITFLSLIIGNMASFIYTNKMTNIRSWFNFILPSILEIIVILAVYYKHDKHREKKIMIIGFIITSVLIGFLILNLDNLKKIRNRDIYGIVPAILFPIGTFFTLYKLEKSYKKGGSNSIFSWVLFTIGMIGVFILDGKYKDIISISAFLIPAVLSSLIIFKLYNDQKKEYFYN